MARHHRRRRRSHHRRHHRSFRRNPIIRRRSFRRNPNGGGGFIGGALVPAAIGAGGAIAVDWLMGAVPLPNMLYQGWAYPVTKIAAALGIGAAIGAVTDDETGGEAAAGAIIVTLYQLARPWFAQTMGIRLGRYKPFGRYLGRFYRGTYVGYVRRARMRGLGALTPPRYRAGPGAGALRQMRLSPFKLGARRRMGLKGAWPGMRLGALRRRGSFPGFALTGARRGLGWVGPARTVKGLGRYLGTSRNRRRS